MNYFEATNFVIGLDGIPYLLETATCQCQLRTNLMYQCQLRTSVKFKYQPRIKYAPFWQTNIICGQTTKYLDFLLSFDI